MHLRADGGIKFLREPGAARIKRLYSNQRVPFPVEQVEPIAVPGGPDRRYGARVDFSLRDAPGNRGHGIFAQFGHRSFDHACRRLVRRAINRVRGKLAAIRVEKHRFYHGVAGVQPEQIGTALSHGYKHPRLPRRRRLDG